VPILRRDWKPYFPQFFRVSIGGLDLSENPIESKIVLDFARYEQSANTIRKIVRPSIIWLLTQCNGLYDIDTLIAKALSEFPEESLQYLEDTLREMRDDNLVLDAVTDPDASPQNSTQRYARHSLFYSGHGENSTTVQNRLRKATVLIIGIGGIGSWVSYLLAAAGVGKLIIADGDTIELSNLTRQVLFTSEDIGRLKVEVAAERLRQLNSDIHVEMIDAFCDEKLLDSYAKNVDLIVASGDKPATLYHIINKFCVRKDIPWIRAGYYFDLGIVGPLIVPGTTGCHECSFDSERLAQVMKVNNMPLLDELVERYKVASFGPINGTVASILSKEIICYLGGMIKFCRTIGVTLVVNILDGTMDHIDHPPRNINCFCGHPS
jgi:molybdopterin/thiamine biosynthesis adenylyltransferase